MAIVELSMNFRRAESTDASAIAAFDSLTGDARRQKLEASIADGRCFVADSAGAVVEHGTVSYDFFERGFVSLLYVNVADRRKGIDAGLLRCLEEACTTTINLHLNQPLESPNAKSVGKKRL